MQIKAIETQYAGCMFRSRTEARWAVAFDFLGVRWLYEHEGFDLDGLYYLPDFWLPDHKMFVEVKGGEYSEEDRAKVKALRKLSQLPVVVVGDLHTNNGRPDDGCPDHAIKCRVPHIFELVDSDNIGRGYHPSCPAEGENLCQHPVRILRLDVVEGFTDRVEAHFKCSAGHKWGVVIPVGDPINNSPLSFTYFHKVENRLLLILAGCNDHKFFSAINHGNSARFEHGETPANSRTTNANRCGR